MLGDLHNFVASTCLLCAGCLSMPVTDPEKNVTAPSLANDTNTTAMANDSTMIATSPLPTASSQDDNTTTVAGLFKNIFPTEKDPKKNAQEVLNRVNFKRIEELCRNSAGLKRGQSIAQSVLSQAGQRGNLGNFLGSIAQNTAGAVFEQDACGLLGQIGAISTKPQGLLQSILSPFLSFVKKDEEES